MKYGLISELDGKTIEKTIDLILSQFPNEPICLTEIGLFNCQTAIGIREYLGDKCRVRYTGIDNEKDKPVENIPEWMNFIKGNSNEVYNQLKDNSQHLIVVDGNHSFPYIISDYYCYGQKVKVGGFLCFHDAALQAQGRGWQVMGDKEDSDMSIAVLKALDRIGLLEKHLCEVLGWKKIFHEWDENDEHGGFIIFKKLY